MKRKRIIGFLGVLLALFAFAGCDAILESFFPEFGEGGDRNGKYQIGIWVEIVVPADETPPPDSPNSPMIGAKAVDAWSGDPEPVAEAYMSPNWDYNEFGDTIFTAYIELYIDYEGEFRVVVWGEIDGNFQPDWDDPQTDAVWWRVDEFNPDGFWDNIFSFYEGDEEFGTWREGEAIIIAGGGGGAPNYQFDLMGPLVLDEDDTANKRFDVVLEDSSRTIEDMSWDLFSFNYSWYDGEWQLLSGTSGASFVPQLSTITSGGRLITGKYWLEVQINFTDGTYRFKRFPIVVVNEVAAGTVAIDVDIMDLDWDPMFLPTGNSYYIRLTTLDGNGATYLTTTSGTIDTTGKLSFSVPTFAYNPTEFTFVGGDGYDKLEIALDIDADGAIESGDFKITYPVALDLGAGGNYHIGIYGWEMRPVFENEGGTF